MPPVYRPDRGFAHEDPVKRALRFRFARPRLGTPSIRRAPVGALVDRGPYRLLSNPMYGIGNIQSYAPALAAASGPGLLVALVFHVAIYAFHLAVERPFVACLERESLA